ncbi:glutathione peroxidase Hyr1 [Erysiphe pulchra]|uniref:Glutathione peroxidase n=1 Tax=Erysiphe pulchra TaxID=225359 RepID=A0A2S4PV10_9PEZI|nr:glutathione peroxidase Hyr1 [Erysiphe pulchra]
MVSTKSFYDFQPADDKGQPVPLSQYKNKVVLVVNTASKCGFTPQLQGLEKLYKKINEDYPGKFFILGFPCNQFGGQDPGSNEEIQNFCQYKYGVTFPVFGKVEVKGDKAEPLFQWLTEEKPGIMGLKRVKWNFEKWLISKDGRVIERWASTASPESLEKPILQEISKD